MRQFDFSGVSLTISGHPISGFAEDCEIASRADRIDETGTLYFSLPRYPEETDEELIERLKDLLS